MGRRRARRLATPSDPCPENTSVTPRCLSGIRLRFSRNPYNPTGSPYRCENAMRRRSRRCCWKWMGTSGCIITILAAAACTIWLTVGIGIGGRFSVSVHGGGICLTWKDPHPVREIQPRDELPRGLYVHPWPILDPVYMPIAGYRSKWDLIRDWCWSGLLPRWYSTGLWCGAVVPLWVFLVVLGVPTLRLWWVDRRRPGHCVECGYNLTGNTAGRCPECGTAFIGSAPPSAP